MLCVNLSALPVDPQNVQRAVDIEDIINTHTRPFADKGNALTLNYAPLTFGVSVRSMYDNTVVGRKLRDDTIYLHAITDVGDFPHKGYDLVMYVSSLVILNMCVFSPELEKVMTQHSQFQTIGLYNPDPGMLNPTIYSHVIMSDEGMKLFAQHLKPEYVVDNIAEMKLPGNRKPIIDTIFEVKKEEDQ